MKKLIALTASLILQASIASAEDVTLFSRNTSNQNFKVVSEVITLNQGDTAKLLYCSSSSANYPVFKVNLNNGDGFANYNVNGVTNQSFAIAGPAIIQLLAGTESSSLATLSITRAGLSSPPAAIPQEAGTTWDVILESSSDLINWTPTNPGEYTGTEPKRFFRTRMVKKEQS
jgi:hypothetical protein